MQGLRLLSAGRNRVYRPAALHLLCVLLLVAPAALKGTSCADFEGRTEALDAECCDEPSEDCSGGAPHTCNAGCAAVLEPFWEDCASALPDTLHTVLRDTVRLCSDSVPAPDTGRLLTETAFVMTHDSATGYLDGNSHRIAPGTAGPTYDEWMKTQTAPSCAQGTQPKGEDCSFSLAGQLDCGARAIDLRPTLQPEGVLKMHHDFLVPDALLSSAVSDVLQWAAKHEDELVLLYVSHCDHDDVEGLPGGSHRQSGAAACAETFDYLRGVGVTIIDTKLPLETLTLGEAMEQAALPSGGRVLGLGPDVMIENWEPSVACYPGLTDCCYSTQLSCFGADAVMKLMWDYADGLTQRREPVPHDGMWMVQGHWQYDPEQWTKGQLHGSSLVLDEQRSAVNAGIAQRISSGTWQRLNIIEVDNICDGGAALLDSVRQFNAKTDSGAGH